MQRWRGRVKTSTKKFILIKLDSVVAMAAPFAQAIIFEAGKINRKNMIREMKFASG